ncbi:MAG: hypothetical protein E7315_05690 [Clostridiales bacterium]|nr:hypothetical protein [Clostridiales bacterium]
MSKVTKEMLAQKAHFEALDYEHHCVVPQGGVKQFVFDRDILFNAIWDYNISPDGHHYFSRCAEGNFPQCVWFYEYFPETNTVKKLFELDKVITTYPRAIVASKIHSCISFMPDGKLIMATHTTACSKDHPIWMPEAYYTHLWEGYPGSNIITYDPKTGKVEDYGIPVVHESIYGGMYDPIGNAFYFTTLLRGHIYRFDLDDRSVHDYGQLTDGGSCRHIIGCDGNLYTSSNNGELLKFNTRTKEFEGIVAQIPVAAHLKHEHNCHVCMFAVNGPDKKIYYVPRANDLLGVYDPFTGDFEMTESLTPEDLKKYPWYGTPYGFDFDDDGVMWYALMMKPNNGHPRSAGGEVGFYLCSWDYFNGGKPVNHGLVGTPERRVHVFCDGWVRNNVFYGADTNHHLDPVSIFQIDLKKLVEEEKNGVKGPVCADPYHAYRFDNGIDVYPGDLCADMERYIELDKKTYEHDHPYDVLRNERLHTFNEVYVTKPWKIVGFEESQVYDIKINADSSTTFVCGGNGHFHRFTVLKGEILNMEKNIEFTPMDKDALAKEYEHLRLPTYIGRRWVSKVTAAVEWNNGRKIIGTKDSMMAIIDGDKVFSLGAMCCTGPVHALATNADKTLLFGVAGDPDDQGILFTYDDDHGVRAINFLRETDIRPIVGESGLMDEPYVIDVSPDGRHVVLGGRDYKGLVFEYFGLEVHE